MDGAMKTDPQEEYRVFTVAVQDGYASRLVRKHRAHLGKGTSDKTDRAKLRAGRCSAPGCRLLLLDHPRCAGCSLLAGPDHYVTVLVSGRCEGCRK